MNLLAVDQGSTHCGLAYFLDDRVLWTKRVSPPAAWPWRRRMRFITDKMRELLAEETLPDVIAIEDVSLGRNAKVAVTMGENRGWLMCVLDHWYPAVQQIAIHPATVRAAVEAGRSRARAIDRYKVVASYMLGGAKVSEDESAAICIGIAARARIDRERLLARVGAGEAKGERKAEMS